jgi:hypothetical protein
MEDKELLNMWKAQNEKIEQSLLINRRLLIETINQKAQTSLRSLKRLKTIGIVSFVFYLIVLGIILFYAFSYYSSVSNYFIVSLSAIFLINLRGLIDYIKHLVWTNNIYYNGSIMEIQQKLSMLQLSIVNHTKIMVLQLPFWTTFYLSDSWFPSNVGAPYIVFQILLTGGLTYLAYWLYKNQQDKNLNKKWYKALIAGSGGRSVEKAIEFYKEIETFRSESL